MRQPAPVLAVDAAILIASVIGKSTGAIFQAAQQLSLVTTSRVIEEARRRIELGLKRPDLLPLLDIICAAIAVTPLEELSPHLPATQIALKDAPASRNGSIADAHLLALAWCVEADIWTYDRDFAGTGVASWSTPNLLRALVAGK